MEQKTYQVTCNDCGATRFVKITHFKGMGQDVVDWLEEQYGIDHKIVSARKRLDSFWGWQCACGNNSLMTSQEQRQITNPVNPSHREIADIIGDLEPTPTAVTDRGLYVDRFILREV